MAYKKPFYVKMMTDAFQQWSDLERRAGVTLFKNTGYLVFGKDTEEYIISNLESLRLNGIPHQTFSGLEANQRYPRQLKIPSTHKCIYEEMGGILYASRSLLAFQQEFVKLGGTILDNHQVTEIIPGDRVTVVTNRGSFKANNVVIAAGPWAPALCSSIGVDLPFKVKRVESIYWKVDNADAYSSDIFPTTFGIAHGDTFYSIPVDEYPNMVKISSAGGIWTDANNRDTESGPVTVPAVADFISSTFRGVACKPSIIDYCMYTTYGGSGHFNVLKELNYLGHGFKLSPVVGKLVAELISKDTPSHDLHPFRVSRFTTPQSSL
ncbi:Peroxisomal sarcosine oxidase [Geodia barretti]|uniref:Peroxisomal sarcosine oxidase n=1 Tax=Geodia barretti TaxID=519541 RepID=A0AA35WHM0_GEOBA|nr:Peroxisomal sarcosine oxidase [Geodia barretti]